MSSEAHTGISLILRPNPAAFSRCPDIGRPQSTGRHSRYGTPHIGQAYGVEAFSLREAARNVGVSANAAYRHFEDKDALLSAVASS
ncbi:helix-turn-helix domain containing protein [Paraburkholderia sp. A2WS-5]|uniref:TetR/AcrR family transcriptional regulator n=1 Tax=unclassified Paraburkholderia TaxID=2615204 RepID=UPI003B791D78